MKPLEEIRLLLLASILAGAGLMLAHLCEQATAASPIMPASESRDAIVSLIYAEADAAGVSGAWLVAVALCETGGTLDPWRVGRQGEIGIFQWHPYGLWRHVPVFATWWDVYDVVLNVRGAAWAFAEGLSYHWSCAR